MATYNDGLVHYNDDAARTAGEAITVDLGTTYTIRTDTRWHANAPASMTGSHGSLTPTNGLINIDATNVRWLAYNTGSGVVPAIGTSITQGAVSGYLLGVWANLTSAPTAVGAAMPATGYIKFREVTGGAYTAGALTGIGASATGADVGGWIEVVCDSGANITVPRLGEFRTRGGWFELPQTTDGTVGQVIQIPTNGGGSGTVGLGLWIETAPSSNEYRYWQSLDLTTDGNWTVKDLGGPYGATDRRCEFVKGLGNGQMQIGEAHDMAGTYEALSQTGTYSTLTQSCTYTWAGDKVTVTNTAGHLLRNGEKVYLDFTTGDATGSDGQYTITMLDLYSYTVDLAGSGAGGNVTAIVGVSISATAHNLGVGDKVYCDFTSGSGADGEYTIRAVTSAHAFYIDYTPATSVSGNVTLWAEYRVHAGGIHYGWVGNQVYLDFTSGAGTDGVYTMLSPYTVLDHTGAATYTWAANVVTITRTLHGKKVGDTVYLDFTSGGATGSDGVYTVVTVPTNSTFTVALAGSGTAGAVTYYSASFRINAHNGGSADSGNVTIKRTIGHIPPSGCKIRIPNVIMRECATATRASNMVNATITSRPEFTVSTAGKIDMEYSYATWYQIYQQGYSIRLQHCAVLSRLYLEEIASALDIDDVHTVSYQGAGYNMLYITNIPSGGTIKNCRFHRGGVSQIVHGTTATQLVGVTFDNCEFGCVNKYKSSGYSLTFTNSSNLTFTNCRLISGYPVYTGCTNITWTGYDYCSCYIGKTSSVYSTYGPYASTSTDVLWDGFTCGYGGAVPDVGPYTALIVNGATTNFTVRNIGSKASPLVCNSFRPNYYGCTYLTNNSGNNLNLRVQNVYVDQKRGNALYNINTDKGVTWEKCYCGDYVESAFAQATNSVYPFNAIVKGCRFGRFNTTGLGGVYGTHFHDYLWGDVSGSLVLNFNEPTAETTSQYTAVAGTPKFNGAGGLLMATVGDQVIFEDSVFRLCHTGFQNVAPVMTGGTIGNYTLEYDIDIGSGYSGSWTALTGANLSAITVDPAIGFKMKYRITTGTANSTAITFLEIKTTSTAAAQANTYPPDLYTLTVNGLETATKVAFLETGTETLLQDVATSIAGAVSYTYSSDDVGDTIDIKILCAGFEPQTITYVLTAGNVTLPVDLVTDYGYDATASADVTFNSTTDLITMDALATTLDVKGMYKEWVAWALTGNNLGQSQAMYSVGGNDIDTTAGSTIPVYVYLINGWQIKPDDADHKLVVSNGVVLTEDGSDPFTTSTGYTVKICFQQPVNAIGVTNQASLASAVWDASMASHTTAGSAGEKVGTILADKTDVLNIRNDIVAEL